VPSGGALASVGLALLLSACASSTGMAPVEDRKPGPSPRAAAPAPAKVQVAPAPPPVVAAPAPAAPKPRGWQNEGKPGFYTVRSGDVLTRIGLEHGQSWRDLARWNEIEDANLIEVGQVLRVIPPDVEPGRAAAIAVAQSSRIETRALDLPPPSPPMPGTTSAPSPRAATAPGGGAAALANAPPLASAPGVPPAPKRAPVVAPPVAAAPSPAPAPGLPAASPSPPRSTEEAIDWAWPAGGPVIAGFDEGRGIKGVSIGGEAGTPVLAAADGRVVYAGSGLRGYGNLVIVKHNNTYLTAYAHNQKLLVREDQIVRRSQPIAEMGASDADRVKLHFEVRRMGKPVDPVQLLPVRP
jgi:lipoprotein NlpD